MAGETVYPLRVQGYFGSYPDIYNEYDHAVFYFLTRKKVRDPPIDMNRVCQTIIEKLDNDIRTNENMESSGEYDRLLYGEVIRPSHESVPLYNERMAIRALFERKQEILAGRRAAAAEADRQAGLRATARYPGAVPKVRAASPLTAAGVAASNRAAAAREARLREELAAVRAEGAPAAKANNADENATCIGPGCFARVGRRIAKTMQRGMSMGNRAAKVNSGGYSSRRRKTRTKRGKNTRRR